ncbi:Rieske (2Fe-2S) protein [Actinocrinis puniceicyclus]|uniref:Cytochrome bc1 complex Rieske iron-sulfur subunit n=1 Tax=Actinocrinis puniceicyclus TaxID=977794 RepID=A0A8J7WJ79_9ACTN|nr:Rieske (2Fe-2S) protein [Actinocrinis puniceicyclus]MBS2963236.1 Rieske (2Fe-2S) protein [Actinocrinis puniceicyclus]
MTSTPDPTDLPTTAARRPAADCRTSAHACPRSGFDRRGLLRGAAAAGTAAVAGAGLSACGHILSPNENVADGGHSGANTTETMPGSPAASGAAAKPMSGSGDTMAASKPAQAHSAAPARPAGTYLAKAGQIPVGGGMVFADHNVVVTQPKAGTYKAFSSVCTHAGCQCDAVTSGMITCPCHDAAFSISDGSVLQGPAPTALPARRITVQDGEVRLQA